MKQKPSIAIRITDHALIRWLERAKGFDMEAMRIELLAVVKDAAATGCTSWRTPDCTYVFSNGTLKTVLPPGCRAAAERS